MRPGAWREWVCCGRPKTNPQGMGNVPPQGGYSYTTAGRDWLAGAELTFIPADPGRYVSLLSRELEHLGQGFAQRAHEAAACHQGSNYLACCAMCGAAAESAILAAAVRKIGNEEQVLREYSRPNGRRLVMTRIFGPQPAEIEHQFMRLAFNLLAHWRDEAAHGRPSSISELDAYHALTALLRFAQFMSANCERLTERQ